MCYSVGVLLVWFGRIWLLHGSDTIVSLYVWCITILSKLSAFLFAMFYKQYTEKKPIIPIITVYTLMTPYRPTQIYPYPIIQPYNTKSTIHPTPP